MTFHTINLLCLHPATALLVVAIPAIIVVVTYVTSWPASSPRTLQPGRKFEPPTLPYCLPYVQHLPAFLWNPGKLYNAGKARFKGSPFTLLLAGTKFHVFSSPETISYVFGRSRKFSFEPVMASMMENAIDLPVADRHNFSSAGRAPGQLNFVAENHNIWTKHLSGPRLDDIMEIYIKNFHRVLAEHLGSTSNDDDWVKVSMHSFIRRLIFEASTLTFFGPRIKHHWPDMWEDWRRYDDATYIGVRTNLAYRLQPAAGVARERMFQAFEKWLLDAEEGDWPEEEGAWCESWGFKMNWERDMMARKCAFTLRGRASLQASFLFVIVTNAAPMASWFTWCAASTPERLARYRAAALEAPGSWQIKDGGMPHLDVGVIKQDPYVHGLWLEALRVGTASAAARVVLHEDAEVEGFLVRQGSVLLLPVQLLHFNEEVFPDPEQILPERWMTKDAGQLKKQHNSMRPFGGGTSLCSGRFVAEHEILAVVTTIVLLYDIRFGGKQQWRFDPRSIGVMAAKDDRVMFLRRRPDLGK